MALYDRRRIIKIGEYHAQVERDNPISIYASDRFLAHFGIDICDISPRVGIYRRLHSPELESYDGSRWFKNLQINVLQVRAPDKEPSNLLELRGEFWWKPHVRFEEYERNPPGTTCFVINKRFPLDKKIFDLMGQVRVYEDENPTQGAISQSETLDGRLTLA